MGVWLSPFSMVNDQPDKRKTINMTKALLHLLVNLERDLHKKSTRRSKEKLDELLHDDFEEIGASGRTYNKVQIIEELLTEKPLTINASNFELRMLSEDIAQLKYKTRNTADNCTFRTTLRTSIWKYENSKWKLVFHQGTVVQTDV
jgi:hypothetical protein